MDETRSDVQAFYKGKTIFITGASGFMGKVLIEKLLYSCSDLHKIYILLRNKRGQSFETRFNDMFKLPLYQRIREEKAHLFKKVIPLNGDICSDNLGLSDKERELLINETNIIFHVAATLKLEAKLKDAVEMNLLGTRRTLDLAKQMKQLLAFVHVSTAFCHVDQQELGERTYDSPDDPQDIVRLVQFLDEDTVDLITPKLLHPHPNTYTYTKRLVETLVTNEYPNLPCTIARPSIVTPSYAEPIPGWVDNLNGPIGLLVGAGKGVIRSMHCNANHHAQVMPVDIAINGLIVIAYRIGAKRDKQKSIPVYNITQHQLRPITWGEVVEKGRKVMHEYPFEGQLWYPDGDIRSSKLIHNIFVFLFQIVPAYLIDFLMLIFRQKRFMIRIQNKILNGYDVLQYFTTRDWIFHNNKLIAINDELSPADKNMFPTVITNIDVMMYFKNLILGARQYCMKEDLSTLPRARQHQKIMYIVHITTIYTFYFGVLYFMYNNFEVVRLCLDYATEKLVSLPIIGGLISKLHL